MNRSFTEGQHIVGILEGLVWEVGGVNGLNEWLYNVQEFVKRLTKSFTMTRQSHPTQAGLPAFIDQFSLEQKLDAFDSVLG